MATPSRKPIPDRALDAVRRGLVIAQDSGTRLIEGTCWQWPVPSLRPNTATRWPRSTHCTWPVRNYHDAGNTANSASSWLLLAVLLDRLGRYRVGGRHSWFRRQSPSRRRRPRTRHRDRPPARCPRRPDLRIARPQGEAMTHRRDGVLRLRPNRPGPSRTERRLEVDDICRVTKLYSRSHQNAPLQDRVPLCETLSKIILREEARVYSRY